VDHERRKRYRKPHDEAEAPIDERRLKVRIGQFSGDGGALVFHGDSLRGHGANENGGPVKEIGKLRVTPFAAE